MTLLKIRIPYKKLNKLHLTKEGTLCRENKEKKMSSDTNTNTQTVTAAENIEITINEPITENVRPTNTNVSDTPQESQSQLEQTQIQKIIEPSGCHAAIALFASFAAVVLTYVFVNMALYKPYRQCRDAVINDLTRGTVVSITPEYIEYDIGMPNTCKILNRGQNTNINSSYMIYRSNIGTCAQDSESSKCDDDIVLFDLLYTLFGMAFTFIVVFVLVASCMTVINYVYIATRMMCKPADTIRIS